MQLGLVPTRTARRWREFFTKKLVKCVLWHQARTWVTPPLDEARLPASLMERFAGNRSEVLFSSLKFLAPLYNTGELALIHRVGYPNQSRSHFNSQRYWENGVPNNNSLQEGIFYRAMIESGLATTASSGLERRNRPWN